MKRITDHGFVPDPSVFPMRHDSPSEQQMRDGFIDVAHQVSTDLITSYQAADDRYLAGIEIELPLVLSDLSCAPQELRDKVLKTTPNTQAELAAHQIEVTPAGPADILHNLMNLENGIAESLNQVKLAARSLGLGWLRIGSFPFCPPEHVEYSKGEPKFAKYLRSPKWHHQNQRPELNKKVERADGTALDISHPMIVGLMNAVQVTVDATSVNDALDKLNRSLMISPMVTALGAHSTHIDGKDTGLSDIRFHAWSVSHDSRNAEEAALYPTRVGLPNNYYTSLSQYFNEILRYPFILDDPISLAHPFEVGNGLFWRDARLKFFRDQKKVGIEFRPIPLQPTLHEDIAMICFYIGRLQWSQSNQEPLIGIDYVRQSKESAMWTGMQAWTEAHNARCQVIYTQMQAIMFEEISRAGEGLARLGVSNAKINYYLGTLRDRVKYGTPAFLFREACNANYSTEEERAQRAVRMRNLVER